MLLMLAEVTRLCMVAKAFPGSAFWSFLCHHQSHAAWVGCSLHDLIQPGFSFLVGTALIFSVANRQAKGQKFGNIALHALTRAMFLIILGFVNTLMSFHFRMPNFLFVDTLTQIGLAYIPLFFLSFRSARELWIAFGVILVGYWAAFAVYPVPGSDFNYSSVLVDPDWLQAFGLTGFAAHWQKNSNLAWAFDVWLLNLLPLESKYVGLSNGLATLSFIPLVGTMILGLFAGQVIRSQRVPWVKVLWFMTAGTIGLAGGSLLGQLGVCPVIKAIWTPSWVLFSGGWCFLLLAAFFVVGETLKKTWILFPFAVVGMNSITAYFLGSIYTKFTFNGLRRVVGPTPFQIFGGAYEPVLYGGACMIGFWLFLYLLYRQRIFLRI